jgi:hypothetical protein
MPYRPQESLSGRSGNMVVAWQQFDNATDVGNIYAQRIANNGAAGVPVGVEGPLNFPMAPTPSRPLPWTTTAITW